MRKIILTLVLFHGLFISTQALFGQQGPLLQKFKYRVSNYRAINYSVNGGSQLDRTNYVSALPTFSGVTGAIGAAYYHYKSTDRILLTKSASLYSSFNSGKSTNLNQENSWKNFNVVPGIKILNKWFSKNMFTELGADFSSNLHFNKNTATYFTSPEKVRQGYYSISINSGIGKGRLENITDMQNALWLNKALGERSLLSRPLTDEELNELGQSITRGNNSRVLDTRIRTQFILKTVDDFFQQKKLISKNDINYFSQLNDILFFAVNNPRLSGTEKFIRFTPAIGGGIHNATANDAITKSDKSSSTQSFILTSGFNKYTPVSLIHQNNYGALLKLAYTSKHLIWRDLASGVITSDTKSNPTLKQAGVNVFFQHAIYPNTRTEIIFDFQSEAGYQHIDRQSQFYGDAGLGAIFHYFISYHTRLNCEVGTFYQKNMYSGDLYFYLPLSRISFNANIGLNISM